MDIYQFLNERQELLQGAKVLSKPFDTFDHFPLGSGQCLYVHNYQQQAVTYQRGVEDLLGYTACEFNSELIHDFFHPDDAEILKRVLKAIISFAIENPITGKSFFCLKYRIRKKSGDYIRILRQANMFEPDVDGKMISNVSLITDISYITSNNGVEWHADIQGLDQEIFRKYVGEQHADFFTPRELEIVKLLMLGLSSAQIGGKLIISRHTVDTHRRKVLEKAQCKNTAELVSFCKNIGLM